ncbi:MAG TPA: aminotransferase class III-fold pyridoxal phosphate-dependent enzyme, partial [Pseudomonadales bacterium]|nr:aminotransferase class III-fold pyridoxal phosphate-dependent enzyme [Pseudomonadales bacterium]
PLACAAAMATLEIYEEEGLFTRGRELDDHWMDNALRLKGEPNVIDVRSMGFIGAIELAPRPGAPGDRGIEAGRAAYEKGVWLRNIGDALVLSPPLIISRDEITRIFDTIVEVVRNTP